MLVNVNERSQRDNHPITPSTYLPEGNPGVQRSTESHPYKKVKKKNVSNVLKKNPPTPPYHTRNLPSKAVLRFREVYVHSYKRKKNVSNVL